MTTRTEDAVPGAPVPTFSDLAGKVAVVTGGRMTSEASCERRRGARLGRRST